MEEFDAIVQQYEEYFLNNQFQGAIVAGTIGTAGVLYGKDMVDGIEDTFGVSIDAIPLPGASFSSPNYNLNFEWELSLDGDNNINGGSFILDITY